MQKEETTNLKAPKGFKIGKSIATDRRGMAEGDTLFIQRNGAVIEATSKKTGDTYRVAPVINLDTGEEFELFVGGHLNYLFSLTEENSKLAITHKGWTNAMVQEDGKNVEREIAQFDVKNLEEV